MSKKSLAAALNVSPRAATGWEKGEYPPEPDHLSSLAVVLGFPKAFFLLDDPAGTTSDAVSFRSLSKKSAAQRDAVLAMCDLAIDLIRWIEERFGLPEWEQLEFYGEAPAIAANLVRQRWGLGIKPVKNMLHLLEAKGVRVLSLSENCREIDACSFWSDHTPVILLNTTVSSERMRFDLAHELAHLVLHQPHENVGPEAEKEANKFASEFLMPQGSIVAHRPKAPTIRSLLKHKKYWNVSAAALAYRLHAEGYISDWNFKSLNIEMGRRGYRTTEPESSLRETSHVLELVLKRLRDLGIGTTFIANQLGMPTEEIEQMLNGLAKVALSGGTQNEVDRGISKRHLRVVK